MIAQLTVMLVGLMMVWIQVHLITKQHMVFLLSILVLLPLTQPVPSLLFFMQPQVPCLYLVPLSVVLLYLKLVRLLSLQLMITVFN
jgi:hypothetical protein